MMSRTISTSRRGCLPRRAAVIALGLSLVTSAVAADDVEPHGGFVTVSEDGTKLQLNGGDFYFSGANSYSVIYNEREVEEIFEVASNLGLNALRIWGFWNGEDLNPQLDEDGNVVRPGTPGTDVYGHYTLQPRPGVFPEEAWRRMDYVLYLAHQHNIKLIVPLANEWIEFGGINVYLEWAGYDKIEYKELHYENDQSVKLHRGEFWTHEEAKELYFDYVSYMLNRKNTFTGVTYKNDPAVMIWEVMNEPRYGPWDGDRTCKAVRDFIAEAAAFIKSEGVKQLVGTGEEGFGRREDFEVSNDVYPWTAGQGEGVDFMLNGAIPDVDVLSIHIWPFQWSLWDSSSSDYGEDRLGVYPDLAMFPPEWIEEHIRMADELGKPLYIGEFGFQILRRDGSDVSDRDNVMKATFDAATASDRVTGVAYWHITSSHTPEEAVYEGPMERKTLLQSQYYDLIVPHDLDFRFDVFCPEDETTCAMIEDYSDHVAELTENPDPPYESPCLEPRERCDDSCILTVSHPDHCGECGNVCKKTEMCHEGECVDLESIYNDREAEISYDDDGEDCAVVTVGQLPRLPVFDLIRFFI